MASIIAYLENYVESTVGLPSDLARFLNTIRVLDERATEVEVALRHTTEALCALKPVGSRAGASDNKVRRSRRSVVAAGHQPSFRRPLPPRGCPPSPGCPCPALMRHPLMGC